MSRAVVPDNPALAVPLSAPALAGRAHCLGERSDIPWLTAALDVACSSSEYGDAFPNAVVEAMSWGVPVVATDAGDVPRVVGEAGIIVSARDVEAFISSWEHLLADPARRLKAGAVRGTVRG